MKHPQLEDDNGPLTFPDTSLAMNLGSVFQLLAERSVQGLRGRLQPVGDVSGNTEQVFKGRSPVPHSAPERDGQSAGTAGKEPSYAERDGVSEREAEDVEYITWSVMHTAADIAGYVVDIIVLRGRHIEGVERSSTVINNFCKRIEK